MRNKVWVWIIAGWLLSLAVSPASVMGAFRSKAKS